MVADCRGAQKLAVRALLEVVQSGGKNIELAYMVKGGKLESLTTEQIEELVKEVEAEKVAEAEAAKAATVTEGLA